MLARCTNRKHPQYPNYGGRGIVVLSRWRKFEEFLADMGDPPAGYTLERMDNDRGYSARNCKWATWTEQANNRRPRRILLRTDSGRGTMVSR
jgi:hypothetical protein